MGAQQTAGVGIAAETWGEMEQTARGEDAVAEGTEGIEGEMLDGHPESLADTIDTQLLTGWRKQMAEIRNQAKAWKSVALPDDPTALQKMKDALDYEGEALSPDEQDIRTKKDVRTSKDTLLEASSSAVKYCPPRTILRQEINNFAHFCKMTDAERRARYAVAYEVTAFMRRAIPNQGASVEVYGSEKTSLAFPTSDIDFRLFRKQSKRRSQTATTKLLPLVYDKMKDDPTFTSVIFRPMGKHPMLCAQHAATGIDIQITPSSSNINQQVHIKALLTEIPALRSVYRLLHATLSARGLTQVYHGGLGSYGLLILLAAALRRRGSKTSYRDQHCGVQLLAALDFLTNHLPLHLHTRGLTAHPVSKPFLKHDWTRPQFSSNPANPPTPEDPPIPQTTTTPNHPVPIPSTLIRAALARTDPVRAGQWFISTLKPLQPYLLSLQDPDDPRNDLGRNAHAIKHILATLTALREKLLREMEELGQREEGEEAEKRPGEGLRTEMRQQGRTLLRDWVGTGWVKAFKEKRARIEGYGVEVSRRIREEVSLAEKPGQEDGGSGGQDMEEGGGKKGEERPVKIKYQAVADVKDTERKKLKAGPWLFTHPH
ncbi:hypothetical protein MBLNU230_g7300t1 [Neophaeotheca triangularis]